MTFENIVQAATILGVIASIYLSLRKAAPEIRVIDSSADRNQAEANKANAEAALLQNQRMLAMEKDLANACLKIENLEAKIISQDAKIEELSAENDLLRNWSERLVHQIRSIDPDITPAPFKRPIRRIDDATKPTGGLL